MLLNMKIPEKSRKTIKTILFKIVTKLTRSARFEEEIRKILKELMRPDSIMHEIDYSDEVPEYRELPSLADKGVDVDKEVILITAGFRSGSTLLWNIFRQLDGFTAYYEPLLHEKPSNRGEGRNHKTDPSHIGIDDYHSEIKSIPGLDAFHESDWAFKKLHMGEHDFNYKLEKYLNTLINNAKDTPVLQFNRVDFRLGWLKKKYPGAKLIHLFRHPRDQWVSRIQNDVFIPKDYQFSGEFYPDINAFYLYDWWRSLCNEMPFLELDYLSHPYQIHYLIWETIQRYVNQL